LRDLKCWPEIKGTREWLQWSALLFNICPMRNTYYTFR
jgi:hypothetical protein